MTIDLDAEADLARCGALKDFWYVACAADELKTNALLARTILGTPLVLFRAATGRPAALLDRCLHRHARLSAGACVDGRVGCPYHGWVYDPSGACVEIPSLGPGQLGQEARGLCVRPSDVGRLPVFPTLEQDGLIFVFLGGEPSRARKAPFRVPHWNEPGWVSSLMVTRFPNGVTNLVENFMDVPHTVFVHRGWFRTPKRREVPATVARSYGEVLITYQQTQDELTGLGRLMNPTGAPMVHTDHFVMPNVTRVDYRWGERSGYMINSQITPVGPLDSIVYTTIAYRLPFDLPRNLVARGLRRLMHWYTTQVIRQDVEIMQVQREGLTHTGRPIDFAGTEADLPHADIEAVRGWLRDGGEGEGPEPRSRTIHFWI